MRAIGFAIPINMAMNIAEDLLDDGAVQRGFLGVQIADLDADGERLHMKEQGGAVVMMVGAGSPPRRPGSNSNVIVSINGQRWTTSSRLHRQRHQGTGTAIPIEVLRNGKPVTVTATLDAREGPRGSQRRAASAFGSTPEGKHLRTRHRRSWCRTFPKPCVNATTCCLNVSGVIVTKSIQTAAPLIGVEEGDVISP
ncbi:MAG: hypothetical protein R3F13_18110 [Prosthecobacter sp.]